jgi:hypothetical protein
MRDGNSGSWKTVAAIADIANVQQGFGGEYNAQIVKHAKGQFADCDPADVLAWTDLNGDELVQRAECTIFPAREKTPVGTRCEFGKPGVPCMDGKGWYTKAPTEVLMVITRKTDLNLLLRYVKAIDPDAFLSVSSVNGVYGQGFDSIKGK